MASKRKPSIRKAWTSGDRKRIAELEARVKLVESRAESLNSRLVQAEHDFDMSQAALREARWQQARMANRVESLEWALTLAHGSCKEILAALDLATGGATKVGLTDAVLASPNNIPSRIAFEHAPEGWQRARG